MKTYRHKNATIHVRGEVDREKLKNAAIQLLTKSYRYKLKKEKERCQKTK